MKKVRSLALITLATLTAASLIFARPSPGSCGQNEKPTAGTLKAGERAERMIPLVANRLYSLSVALDHPGSLDPNAIVRLTVADSQRELATKPLHVGDSDCYVVVRATSDGQGRVTLAGERGNVDGIGYSLTMREWTARVVAGKEVEAALGVIEAEPNNSWQEATPFQLGQPVFATNDDRDLIAPLSPADRYPQPPSFRPSPYGAMGPQRDRSEDWFTFTQNDEQPRLVFFQLDFLDREVPCDVLIYKRDGDSIVECKQGADPVSDPHEVQALPGNKFTTRVIDRGIYFVKVTANHPVYQLRTYTYDVPPYLDADSSNPPPSTMASAARKAVRAGVDYAVAAGDSWHANTPRSGGVTTRVASTHNETQQCIACHPTHFTTRAQQVAVENGYTVRQRSALKFLTERLYNSPRPFYGHKDTTWARMISSSANVMSRLGYLLNLHERNLTRETRNECLQGVAGYLKLYYRGRTELPPEETNGNAPLVSAYEIAGHSWAVFNELSRREVGDPARRNQDSAYCNQLRGLIEQDHIKDMRDLCYQTIALAWIDRAAYAERIKQNCERILSLQRASGQWAMTFNATDPEAEFQTGHCLYTLALAGYSPQHPQIAKAIRYLLGRQQPFGGWFDPQQSYENFKTPFRETQFAVMALATFFPEESTASGKQRSGSGSRWSAGFGEQPKNVELEHPARAIAQLDQIWDAPSPETLRQVLAATAADEPLLRATACETLGRVGNEAAMAPLIAALADRLKIVRHSAAWALRELATRKQAGLSEIARALRSDDNYTQRGAVRVFAQHFSYLTRNENSQELIDSLIRCSADSDPFVRLYAAKALSQWFYWSGDKGAQVRIAQAFLSRMAENDHPWVRRATLENFYSICDDNIRYLYRNWIPLLARDEDRARTTNDHHALMDMLARQISAALTGDNATLRDNVLLALTQHTLRRSGDRQAYGDIVQTPAGLYSRIGNDIEHIKFYEESTAALEPALMKWIDDPATRETALIASFMLRDTTNLSLLPLKMAEIIATDRNARNRETAWEYYRFLPIVVTEQNRARWSERLGAMFTGTLEARKAAFDTLARAGAELQKDEKLNFAFSNYLQSEAANAWRPELLTALAALPKLHERTDILEFVQDSLKTTVDSSLRAALLLVLHSSAIQRDATTRVAFLSRLRDAGDPQARLAALELANRTTSLLANPHIVSLVADALSDSEPQVRSAALAAVQKSKGLAQNPAVQLALRGAQGDSDRALDYAFFKANVQPLLYNRARGDCIRCHFNHNILQLHSKTGASFTDDETRADYRSALKVVNPADPERSLLLQKPISDASAEGQLNARSYGSVGSDGSVGRVAHGGGVRWKDGERSDEYRAILAWIQGAGK